MIIEQAFHNMPEILLGSGYAQQEYKQGFEASLVAAFSLAIMQELNGRNVPNPISCLMAEKKYPSIEPNLRADLHVDLSKLFTGSAQYARYGFRFSNWIEAKYFKHTNGTPPNTQNLGLIVNDIMRLVVLVPTEDATDSKTRTGRYFLHVYQGNPFEKKLIIAKRSDNTNRSWIEQLLKPGPQYIKDFELDKEKNWKSFFTHFPRELELAKLEMEVNNYILTPLSGEANDLYTIALTRIESAKIEWKNESIKLNKDRTIEYTGDGTIDNFRKKIALIMNPNKRKKSKKITT